MATLIVQGPSGSERRVELARALTVGRDPSNELVLSDAGASRRHCRLELDAQGAVWVEDLGSANGVYLDGARVQGRARLDPGATLTLGSVRLTLEDDTARDAARAPTVTRLEGSPPATSGPRPTRMLTASELPQRRAATPTVSSGTGAPRLAGLGGALTGKLFALDKPRLTVGRVAPADLVLGDESVSRRHAELVVASERVVVRDLDSANGTFLNGARVAEAPLAPGDVVRVGAVELRYAGTSTSEATERRPGRARRRMWLAAAVAVPALGLVLAAGALWNRAPTQAPARPAEAPAPDARATLRQCRAAANAPGAATDWKRVSELCAQALALDATLAEARALEQRAQRELEDLARLETAQAKVAAGQDEQALAALAGIDPASSGFAPAREHFREIAGRVARQSLDRCRALSKGLGAGRALGAVESCRRTLELTCHLPGGVDPEVQRLFERAARLAKQAADLACPPEYLPFQTGPAEEHARDAEEAIRARVAHSQVAGLLIGYYRQGRPRQVADALRRLRGRDAANAGELAAVLERIDAQYAKGEEGLLKGALSQSERAWQVALDAESKLLPDGVRSALAREMRAELGAAYYRAGREEQKRGNLAAAFRSFGSGWRHDPASPELLGAMADLEQVATRALESPTCASVADALAITLERSEAHARAMDLRAKLGCR